MERRSLLKSLAALPLVGLLSRFSFAASRKRSSVDRSTWTEHELKLSPSQSVRFRLPEGYFLLEIAGQRVFPAYGIDQCLSTNVLVFIVPEERTLGHIGEYANNSMGGDGVHKVTVPRARWTRDLGYHDAHFKWAGLQFDITKSLYANTRARMTAGKNWLQDAIEVRAEELLLA
jgi:hypothetical protein